jgi:DNA-binding NarL/FixJ family response regulator
LRDELVAVATLVSLRLVELDVRATPEPGRLGELSPRQFEVAQLVSRGRANSEIASTLGLSENTVKKHLKDLFAKLEVVNRTELATLMARSGARDTVTPGITRLGHITITKAR